MLLLLFRRGETLIFTKVAISLRQNAHFHFSTCATGLSDNDDNDDDKDDYEDSHILVSLTDRGPQDLQCCVSIVFYNGKWPSGSPNPIIYSTFWGSEKGPREGPGRCPIHPSSKRPPQEAPRTPSRGPQEPPSEAAYINIYKNICVF